ncbi:hypothetical protein E4G67_03030 [Candidatus Bathyarchaeota archaeon]|nr:MAG: hypothetical protein E4G67_03030 [Candidatus Bathyarchaeota archaeon]
MICGEEKDYHPKCPNPRSLWSKCALRLDVTFDLDFSLCCGQVFRWRKINGWWYGVVGEQLLRYANAVPN